MGRPSTLPGILGALAGILGVSGLAEALDTTTRTLYNWAFNKSSLPAISAGLAYDLCYLHGVKPLLYTHPNLANGYVASTAEGWVMWTWGANDYSRRTRYFGHMAGLKIADRGDLLDARAHGWPW